MVVVIIMKTNCKKRINTMEQVIELWRSLEALGYEELSDGLADIEDQMT